MGHRERGWLYAALVAGAISAMAFSTMRPGVLGLFHDDGIYAVTARSLAAGTGYRIVSLPGAPAQTKYPFLYPYLLSWVWRASPAFPANVLLLKSVNALIALAVMLLGYALFCRHTGRFGISALAYVFLVGTNMLLVSAADFTLSDNLFQIFVIACLLLHEQGARGRSSWWIWFGAVMASLGFLTRVPGASLVIAGLVWTVVEKSRREAIIYAAIAAGLTIPWFVWRADAVAVTNPLLPYYTEYETSAIALAPSHPYQAWQILSGNARYLLQSLDATFLLQPSALLRWSVVVLVLLGSWVLLRRRLTFLVVFVAVYTGAVLNHPFVPGRYVVPLVPIVLLALFAGAFEAHARLANWAGSPRNDKVIAGLVGVPIALLMALNLVWFRSYNRSSSDDHVRGFGRHFAYGWSGFTETFEWVRNHTAENELLATPYDPMYYLYTGRKGVRPWFHNPESYFYPIESAVPNLGDPARIRDALNDLGVRYLIIDPLEGYAESVAAPQLFERLLSTYSATPRLVFTSRDSAHKIYDLRPAPGLAVQ
ncbi:MAG: hypothetical protein ABJA98_10850 [Acidobacteriota bacterium]